MCVCACVRACVILYIYLYIYISYIIFSDPYDSRRRNRGSRGRGAAMDRVNDGASVAGRLGLPLNRNNNRNNRQSHSRSNKNYSDDGLQWFKVKVRYMRIHRSACW